MKHIGIFNNMMYSLSESGFAGFKDLQDYSSQWTKLARLGTSEGLRAGARSYRGSAQTETQ